MNMQAIRSRKLLYYDRKFCADDTTHNYTQTIHLTIVKNDTIETECLVFNVGSTAVLI